MLSKKNSPVYCGVLLTFFILSCSSPKEYDTIIRNGMVYDGSGGEPYQADIGIKADSIAFIGDLSKKSAVNDVDATGNAVAPGFIDTHSHHAGNNPFDHRGFEAAVSQGITTIVVGQDGSSSFPLSAFFQQLSDTPVAVNIASYSGHNTIRDSILGNDFKRIATSAEIEKMKALLKQDMEAGALGLSTGLEYDPGIYSANSEVLELANVVAPYGGRYISHIRSEDRYFWNAIDEILTIGKVTGIPVQISHVKLAMHRIWGQADSLIGLLDKARHNGVDVTADIYPYAFWNSTIRVLFPGRNFSDEKEAELILKEITLPQDIILGSYEVNPAYAGKNLAAIAALENKPPSQMLTELIARLDSCDKTKKEGCEENIMATSMSEEDIKKMMRWPHTNLCSDGSSSGTHPRGYGAFTRFLGKYVRDEKIMTLAPAIKEMTSLAAAHMGFKKRGSLAVGFPADIVVFSPSTVGDQATVKEPHKISAGIEKVWVNGTLVFENSKTTGAFPGRVIKRN